MAIISNEASKRLGQYLADHPDSKTGEKLPLVFRGERRLFDVFRLPVDLLTYNVKNGRLRVDVLRHYRTEGREIEPWSTEGKAFLKERLLAQKGGAELIASLDQNGQVEPGLITYDGIVLNANRRMAAISELDENCTNHPPGRHKYLLAGILPPDVTEEELYEIEANLQFGFDYKEKYGPMNELLKIREGCRFKQPKQLAVQLGKSCNEIEEKLEVLELIEDYLAQINHPREYELVSDEETYSHFAELPALLEKLKNSGKSDEAAAKYLTLAFTMIKGGREHREVRKLKKMCELPEGMENRVLELADGRALVQPPNQEQCLRIENRIAEGESYIRQETAANAPIDIAEDLIARIELLQPKKDAPYREDLLEKLKTLREKVDKKISFLETAG